MNKKSGFQYCYPNYERWKRGWLDFSPSRLLKKLSKKKIAEICLIIFFLNYNYCCCFQPKSVAERTSYFCLKRKLIWPLWSTHIFTQWEWLILFNPDHFSGQHQNGESPPNSLFLRIIRTGQTYLLSASFIAAASPHHEESHLINGPLESTLLDQGLPVEYELDASNPPHTGTPSRRP